MAAIKEATFEDEPEEKKKKKRKKKKPKEPTVPEGDTGGEPSESTTDKPAELTAENAPEPRTSDAKTDNEIPQEQQKAEVLKTTPNKGKQPANKNKTTPKKSSDAAIDSVTDANKAKPEESSPKHSKVCFIYNSL